MEGFTPQSIEAEIQELSKQIEEKRSQLEMARGISPEKKEVVHEVLKEHIFPSVTTQTSTSSPTSGGSYLQDLDEESVQKLNALIELVPKQGIKKTIEQARKESPFLLDAFHDTLTDHLYNELEKYGLPRAA